MTVEEKPTLAASLKAVRGVDDDVCTEAFEAERIAFDYIYISVTSLFIYCEISKSRKVTGIYKISYRNSPFSFSVIGKDLPSPLFTGTSSSCHAESVTHTQHVYTQYYIPPSSFFSVFTNINN